jgi:hypothetical protein
MRVRPRRRRHTRWRAARAARLRAWRQIPLLEKKALSCAELGQHVEAGTFALKALQLRTKYPQPVASTAPFFWVGPF